MISHEITHKDSYAMKFEKPKLGVVVISFSVTQGSTEPEGNLSSTKARVK